MRNEVTEGEPMEQKVRRILNNKEPITDGAPMIYTDKKDGVLAGYDIRTDRFEVAAEAMDKIHRSTLAKRDEAGVIKLEPTKDKKDGGAESIHGTNKPD